MVGKILWGRPYNVNRSVIIGIIGVAAIAVAIGLNVRSTDDGEVATRRAEAPSASEAAKPALPSPAAEPKAAQPTAPSDKSQSTETAAAKPATLPSFDVVRINPTGDAVIAGRAAPGAQVTIYDGDQPIGTVKADERGEWVLIPKKPLPPGSRELSLVAKMPDGSTAKSEDVVVLAVPEAGKDVAGRAAKKPATPLAMLVPRKGLATKKVLQKPSVPGGVTSGGVSLDVVDYDDDGNLSLSGTGHPGAKVFVYLDNKVLGSADVGADGAWRLRPEGRISPGLYKLRVDEVRDRKVVARVELPFARAEPLKDFAGEAFVVVQPGNSLWRIARRTYGEGVKYTLLFDANKDQIRDPDLIYPGQVFAIPRTN